MFSDTVTKDDVEWCYRHLLGREPESEDVIRKHLQSHRLRLLLNNFVSSPEFQKRVHQPETTAHVAALQWNLPRSRVDLEVTEDQLKGIAAKIGEAWTHLGNIKPHFSVLTDKKFSPEHLQDNINEFWASGESEYRNIQAVLARNGVEEVSRRTAVEYGCGVGRVTMALAGRFKEVHAYDVSPGHLKLASERAQQLSLVNVQFHQCKDALGDSLAPCDFFYSRIVLQHNPPPVIHRILQRALAALTSGGLAVFQVPTFQTNYSFDVARWLATPHVLDMQMHCLPQQVIFALAANAGCEVLEVMSDASTGDVVHFVSNVFVLRKK
jgi:trans-aconitate methyltransferase